MWIFLLGHLLEIQYSGTVVQYNCQLSINNFFNDPVELIGQTSTFVEHIDGTKIV